MKQPENKISGAEAMAILCENGCECRESKTDFPAWYYGEIRLGIGPREALIRLTELTKDTPNETT